jgi:hypothetical protein
MIYSFMSSTCHKSLVDWFMPYCIFASSPQNAKTRRDDRVGLFYSCFRFSGFSRQKSENSLFRVQNTKLRKHKDIRIVTFSLFYFVAKLIILWPQLITLLSRLIILRAQYIYWPQDNKLWPQNNISRHQDIQLWQQDNDLCPEDNILRPQDDKLWTQE